MIVRSRHFAAALTAAAALFSAVPSNAAVLPVGAGTWSSTNVSPTGGCANVASGLCAMNADSKLPAPVGTETCTNVSYVVTTPVIVGTNLGCHVHFAGVIALTGTGTSQSLFPDQDSEVDIDAGACAGLVLVGPSIDITDGAYGGTLRLYPRVLVTNAGWKIDGNFVGVNISTQAVQIVHVVGSVTPGCKRVKAQRGNTSVTFSGVFSGSYQTL